MLARFQGVMQKLSLLGFDQSTLTDCSEVIPKPAALAAKAALLPAGTSEDDIEASCAQTPFPTLSVIPGAQTSIPAV